MSQNRVKAISLTSINSTALTGGFAPVNPAGLDSACFLIRIVNGGDTDIGVSFDGSNENEQILSNSSCDLYVQASSQPNSWACLWPKGQKVYVRGTAGSSGVISLSGYYQSQGA